MQKLFRGVCLFLVAMVGLNSHGAQEIVNGMLDQAVHEFSDDAAPDAPLAANAPTANQPAPAATSPAVNEPAAAPSEPTVLYDETTFVERDGALAYTFTVKQPASIHVSVAVDADVPVDVLFDRGMISVRDYLRIAHRIAMNDEIDQGMEELTAFFGGNTSTTDESTQRDLDNLFASPFAKRGVYRTFDSAWVKIDHPGDYTVVVDNTDAFSPTRGDAPVKLQIAYK